MIHLTYESQVFYNLNNIIHQMTRKQAIKANMEPFGKAFVKGAAKAIGNDIAQGIGKIMPLNTG
jgi:hypothetical protein